eukprot:576422-Rhodomonas_salina.1
MQPLYAAKRMYHASKISNATRYEIGPHSCHSRAHCSSMQAPHTHPSSVLPPPSFLLPPATPLHARCSTPLSAPPPQPHTTARITPPYTGPTRLRACAEWCA